MSHFDPLLKFCRRHPYIYCFGTGNMTLRIEDFLNKYGIHIDGYILLQKSEDTILDVPVYHIQDIVSLLKKGGGIIFPLGEKNLQRILKRLPIPVALRNKTFFLVTLHDVITKINVDLSEGTSFFVKINNRRRINAFIEKVVHIELSKKEDFQKKYIDIHKKYKKIVFGQYYMRHIGEMCLTYYLWCIENKGIRNILYVMVPILTEDSYDKIPNSYFFHKIKNEIEIIDYNNYEFWRWMFQNHMDEIEFSDRYDWVKMKKRDMDYIDINESFFHVELDSKEQETLDKMRIGDKFVCIYNRDNEYYKSMGMRDKKDRLSCCEEARNTSIADYYLLAKEYMKKEIPLVRMGYLVEENVEKEGIIDYANKYRTEKLDFYLISKCRFFIVSGSGIMLIAKLFNTPLVVVNSAVLSFGGDMVTPMSPERDLIIMKKLWYQKQNRYLTLDEILYMEGKFKSYEIFDAYQDRGIVFHSNSQEELLDVAEEMRNRLEDNCVYTVEDEKLQKKYRAILEKNIKGSRNHYYNGRFGASFLKKNSWFLQCIPKELSIKNTI